MWKPEPRTEEACLGSSLQADQRHTRSSHPQGRAARGTGTPTPLTPPKPERLSLFPRHMPEGSVLEEDRPTPSGPSQSLSQDGPAQRAKPGAAPGHQRARAGPGTRVQGERAPGPSLGPRYHRVRDRPAKGMSGAPNQDSKAPSCAFQGQNPTFPALPTRQGPGQATANTGTQAGG